MNYATKVEYDAAIEANQRMIRLCGNAIEYLVGERDRKFPAEVVVVNGQR